MVAFPHLNNCSSSTLHSESFYGNKTEIIRKNHFDNKTYDNNYRCAWIQKVKKRKFLKGSDDGKTGLNAQ